MWKSTLGKAQGIENMGRLSCYVESRDQFDINAMLYQDRKLHCRDKMVVRSSFLHNETCYTVDMLYVRQIEALESDWLKTSADHHRWWHFCYKLFIWVKSAVPVGTLATENHQSVKGGWGWGRRHIISEAHLPHTHLGDVPMTWRSLERKSCEEYCEIMWRIYILDSPYFPMLLAKPGIGHTQPPISPH